MKCNTGLKQVKLVLNQIWQDKKLKIAPTLETAAFVV